MALFAEPAPELLPQRRWDAIDLGARPVVAFQEQGQVAARGQHDAVVRQLQIVPIAVVQPGLDSEPLRAEQVRVFAQEQLAQPQALPFGPFDVAQFLPCFLGRLAVGVALHHAAQESRLFGLMRGGLGLLAQPLGRGVLQLGNFVGLSGQLVVVDGLIQPALRGVRLGQRRIDFRVAFFGRGLVQILFAGGDDALLRDGLAGQQMPDFSEGLEEGQPAERGRADQPLGADLQAGHDQVVFDEAAARQQIGQGFLAALPFGLLHAGQRVAGVRVPVQGFVMSEMVLDVADAGLGVFGVFIDQQRELIMEVRRPVVFLGKGALGAFQFGPHQGAFALAVQQADLFLDLRHAGVVGRVFEKQAVQGEGLALAGARTVPVADRGEHALRRVRARPRGRAEEQARDVDRR